VASNARIFANRGNYINTTNPTHTFTSQLANLIPLIGIERTKAMPNYFRDPNESPTTMLQRSSNPSELQTPWHKTQVLSIFILYKSSVLTSLRGGRAVMGTTLLTQVMK